MSPAHLPQRPGVRLSAVWNVQEPGYYVLTLGEHVLGRVIEAPDGTFISFDAEATPLARHDTLVGAQAHVRLLTDPDDSNTSRRAPVGLLAAVAAGSLLMTLLTVAEALLPR